MSRDVLDATFRPLPVWPYPETTPRRSSPFRSGWADTLGLLSHELDLLDATGIVLGAGFHAADLRKDGWPRAAARTTHPGIVVSFDQPGQGRVTYHTDACDDWQDNVRSIAKGLGALRDVGRYGITDRGQQYAGFRQLTSGAGASFARGEALVRRFGGVAAALRATHPDTRQGSEFTDDDMESVVLYRDETK